MSMAGLTATAVGRVVWPRARCLGAQLVDGFDLVAEVELKDAVSTADLVITGEGL